jgi:murein DD-endopeptidase MepM/ murein hydrolase activator NlpD
MKTALKQKVCIKKIFLCGVLSIALVFAFMANPQAAGQTNDELNRLKQEKQKELDEINKRISQLQSQINQRKSIANSLNNDIAIINLEIQETEAQMQVTNSRIEVTNLEIAEVTNRIIKTEADIKKQKEILRSLIFQIYEMDQMSPLEVFLLNDNFTDFLDKMQYTTSIQERSQEVLGQIKILKADLEKRNSELRQQKTELDVLKGQLAAAENELVNQRKVKQQILNETKGQERAYQQLLAESKSLEGQIQKEISDLETELRKRLGDTKMQPTKGVLAWPMKGTLTQGYGNTGFTALGYTFHNGIDIAAPAGTPIYAAADGTVMHTGTGRGAYGNWVTIKHNVDTKTGKRSIITLYGHMSRFVLKPGQQVKQGDLVGYEGNTGITTALLYGPGRGYHLHFSVFDANGYGVAKGTVARYGDYMVPYGVSYNPFDFL